MASISQRGRAWRVHIRRAGKSLSATFDSKTEAQDWATMAEAAVLEGKHPRRQRPVHGPTIARLFSRYAAEISPTKRGERWERLRLHALVRDYPVFSLPIVEFDAAALCSWRDERLLTVSAPALNRELNLLSAVFTRAIKEWRIGLLVNPVRNVMRPRNPPCRTRRVSVEERAAIAAELKWDLKSQPRTPQQWTAFAFYLALETAMRRGEIVGLTWGNVYLEGQCAHLPVTKNGESRDVPLSSRAIALLRLLTPGTVSERVVPISGGIMNLAFIRAKAKIGLSDLHFHDSRREAATVFSERLSNVLELAAVTGHKSLQSLRVYYKPKAQDLATKLG